MRPLALTMWLAAAGFLGQDPLSRAVVTFYDVRGCVAKGDTLVVHGNGFGNARGTSRVVLWAGGVAIEMMPMLWSDGEIRATVPADDRVVAGRMYQVGIQDPLGRWLSNIGPTLSVCESKAKSTPPQDLRAQQLAEAVVKASGGATLERVKAIAFTCNVVEGTSVVLSVKHRWDVHAGKDTVTWKDKTVTADFHNPGRKSRDAYARWVNDSFWLLAPLMLGDTGVALAYGGRKDGFEVLHVKFAPGDECDLFIDPKTHLVRRSAGEKGNGTWDDYQLFDGLNLSTNHQLAGKRISFSDVRVETEQR